MLEIIPSPDRDEIFVKNYVRSKDAVDACSKARIYVSGYDMRDVADYQMRRPEIRSAIARAEAAKTQEPPMEFTRESAVSDLQDVYERCMEAGEFTPAITAKKTQAQLMGLLDQNVTLTVKHDASAMSDEQLEKIISARLAPKVIEGEYTERTPKPPGKQMLALGLAGLAQQTTNAKG